VKYIIYSKLYNLKYICYLELYNLKCIFRLCNYIIWNIFLYNLKLIFYLKLYYKSHKLKYIFYFSVSEIKNNLYFSYTHREVVKEIFSYPRMSPWRCNCMRLYLLWIRMNVLSKSKKRKARSNLQCTFVVLVAGFGSFFLHLQAFFLHLQKIFKFSKCPLTI